MGKPNKPFTLGAPVGRPAAKPAARPAGQALSKAVKGVGLPEVPTVAVNEKAQREALSVEALFGALTANAGPTRDRVKIYPGTGLTPTALAGILRQADLGYVWRWQELIQQAINRDSRLKALRRGTEVGIVGRPANIQPCDATDEAAAMCAFIQEELDGCSGFSRSMRYLLGARIGGFAATESIYHYRTVRFPWKGEPVHFDAIAVDELRTVHGKHFELSTDNTSDEPLKVAGGRVLQVQGQTPLLNVGAGRIFLPRAKFLFHVDSDDGLIQERGWMRAAIWLHMLKQRAVSQWAEFVARFGIPNVRGSVPYNIWADKKRSSMYARFIQLYGDGIGSLFPDDLKISVDAYQAGGTSRDAFASFIGWVDTQYAILAQGEHLTTEIGDTGSYNAASEQAREKQAVIEEMHQALCETMRDFFRMLIWLNREKLEALLGVPAWLLIRKAPRIFWRLDTKTSRMERLEEFELAIQMGLDVTERQVREEGNIDPPAPGEKVLKGPGRDAATRAAAQQRRKRGGGASTDKKKAA